MTDFPSQRASVIGNPVWSPDGAQLVFELAFNCTSSLRPSLYAIMTDRSATTLHDNGNRLH